MFLLVSIQMPAVSALSLDPQPGSSLCHVRAPWRCLRPSYLIVFANRAVVGERPRFSSVWHSSASVLSSPTSHSQDLAAVGCFSAESISNHVIWSSDGKLRDLKHPWDAGLGMVGRGTRSHIPPSAAEEDWEGTFAAGCLWMISLWTPNFCHAAYAIQLPGLASMWNLLLSLEGSSFMHLKWISC